MARDKEKVCKECGYLAVDVKECPNCGGKQFLDKFKGRVLILDSKRSLVAQKLNIKNKGSFALKYG